MAPFAARALASRSAIVRRPELRGVWITSAASVIWQIGARSAVR